MNDLPKTCKARNRRVVWMDPPPATVTCDCGCVVPSDKPCHCGATFTWRVDPYDGWTLMTTLPPDPLIKIRGVDN